MKREELDSLHDQLQTHKKSLEQVDSSIKRLVEGSDDEKKDNKRSDDRSEDEEGWKRSSLSSKVVRLNKSLNEESSNRSGSSRNSVSEALSYKRKLSENEERRVVRSRNDDNDHREPNRGGAGLAKNIQSKEELIKIQSRFSGSVQRNKRILGVIVGTLQKFKTDDSERSTTVQAQNRKELEKKIEVKKVEESKKIAEERKRLEREKNLQMRAIRILEDKIALTENFELWKKNQTMMKHAIRTKSKPEIYYKPNSIEENEKLRSLRDESANQIEDEIKTRQKMVDVEIEALNQESASLESSMNAGKTSVDLNQPESKQEDDKKSDDTKDINLEEEKSEVRLGDYEEMDDNGSSEIIKTNDGKSQSVTNQPE